jgi:hypothetical protein
MLQVIFSCKDYPDWKVWINIDMAESISDVVNIALDALNMSLRANDMSEINNRECYHIHNLDLFQILINEIKGEPVYICDTCDRSN